MRTSGIKVLELRAENVKRLRAVEIRPAGPVVEIVGRNAQGKSSVLDAIAYALGGAGLCPAEPIRQGEERASATVTLDNGLVVERSWTAKGNYLVVRDRGEKVTSPQQVLDRLVGSLTFDPLEFYRRKPQEQATLLIDMLGISETLAALDAERDTVYAARTEWGRERDRLAGVVASFDLSGFAGLPERAMSADELAAELEATITSHQHWEGLGLTIQGLDVQMRDLGRQRDDAIKRRAELQHHIEVTKQAISDLGRRIGSIMEEIAVARTRLQSAPEPDVSEVARRMGSLQQTNELIRQRDLHRENNEALVAAQEQCRAHSDRLQQLADTRSAALRQARYPIDGLGYDAAGPTYRGVPLAQCSSAEQLRVSLAIAMATNPKLRVLLIRDGSLLDDESMQLVTEAVMEADYQLWIERVADGSVPGAVVIEDGMVMEQNGGQA